MNDFQLQFRQNLDQLHASIANQQVLKEKNIMNDFQLMFKQNLDQLHATKVNQQGLKKKKIYMLLSLCLFVSCKI